MPPDAFTSKPRSTSRRTASQFAAGQPRDQRGRGVRSAGSAVRRSVDRGAVARAGTPRRTARRCRGRPVHVAHRGDLGAVVDQLVEFVQDEGDPALGRVGAGDLAHRLRQPVGVGRRDVALEQVVGASQPFDRGVGGRRVAVFGQGRRPGSAPIQVAFRSPASTSMRWHSRQAIVVSGAGFIGIGEVSGRTVPSSPRRIDQHPGAGSQRYSSSVSPAGGSAAAGRRTRRVPSRSCCTRSSLWSCQNLEPIADRMSPQ